MTLKLFIFAVLSFFRQNLAKKGHDAQNFLFDFLIRRSLSYNLWQKKHMYNICIYYTYVYKYI